MKPNDETSAEALEVQYELFRKMTPAQRFRKGLELTQAVKDAMFAAIREANPNFDEAEVKAKFVEIQYGKELAVGYLNALRDSQ